MAGYSYESSAGGCWMTTYHYGGGYRFDLVEHILDVRVRDERRKPRRSWHIVPW